MPGLRQRSVIRHWPIYAYCPHWQRQNHFLDRVRPRTCAHQQSATRHLRDSVYVDYRSDGRPVRGDFGTDAVLPHYSEAPYQLKNESDMDETDLRRALAAENWNAPIVVTTAVQFFESLYSNATSRCRKLHNIADSVIVFDEAQTLPVPYLRPCVRAIAELVERYGSTAVLCTATQPELQPLFDESFDGDHVRVPEISPFTRDDRDSFRRVTIKRLGDIALDALAERLGHHKQVLCVVEQQWQENYLTTAGHLEHERAHDYEQSESRGDTLIMRDLRVFSRHLGITGACDVVEFHQSDDGVPLRGRNGLWSAYPIEYKHGQSKTVDADRLQLCAEAMCLEEMLSCEIVEGALFYQRTRRRERVELTEELRGTVVAMVQEMHQLFSRGHTPRVKPRKACSACSLKDICLPELLKAKSAEQYIHAYVNEETS